jgi:hypothetical protein
LQRPWLAQQAGWTSSKKKDPEEKKPDA